MSNFQKILFSGMILLTVFWGNYFNNGARVSGGSRNNPAEFSALGTAPFLAQSIGVVESASSVSRSADSAPPPESSSSLPQTGWDSANIAGALNAPEPEADISDSSQPGAGLLNSAASPAAAVFYRVKNDPAPVVGAKEALLVDLQSGEAYFETNADTRWPMASLTKLMTAAVIIDHSDLKSRITLAPADFVGEEETDFFKTGSAYSAGDVLDAMLLLSKNAAAEALANSFGREKFVEVMNKNAAEWGIEKTHFADPTGLSVANQSTVRDLRKLALRLHQQYPKIFETTRRKSAVITELGSGKKSAISNINLFAGTSGFLGGKTGYTDDAGGNLLSIFSYERRPVLIIVLGTDDRFGETEKLLNWFKNNFQANK